MNHARLGTTLLLALSGCGAGPVTGDDEAGDSETSATTETSTDTDTTDTTDTTETTDTDTDTTDTDTGTLECPPPQPVTARFTVTPAVPLTATCTVTSEVSDFLDHYEMMLDCAGTEVTVAVDSTILRMPNPGAMVEFDYRTDGLDAHWLAIHQLVDQQALVLGGVSAWSLEPPGTTSAEFFRDPVLWVAPEQPCETTNESCGDVRRLALNVTIDWLGPLDPVFDHGSWYADFLAFGYAIEVEVATRIEANQCDVPDERFELLVVWFPSD